jgi:hypothetical protein
MIGTQGNMFEMILKKTENTRFNYALHIGRRYIGVCGGKSSCLKQGLICVHDTSGIRKLVSTSVAFLVTFFKPHCMLGD